MNLISSEPLTNPQYQKNYKKVNIIIYNNSVKCMQNLSTNSS